MTSVNELLRDEAIRHAVDLQQHSNQTVRRIMVVLNRADDRLFAELTQALQKLEPSSFTVERLESMLYSVRSINSEAFKLAGQELTSELRDLVEYEAAYQRQAIVTLLPVQVQVAAVSAEMTYAAALARPFQGVLLKGVLNDLEAGKAKKIRQTVAQGYMESKTTDQIIRELRGTKAKGYADGLLQGTRRDVEAVTRTALGHMAGFTQDRFLEANVDLIKGVVWSSTLDMRTSETCFPAETLALPVGDIRGVSRRFWQGDMVVVTTASGKQLKSTPNHPVLTARGWRAIHELRPGNDVLQTVKIDVAGVAAPKDIQMPTTIGAISDALDEPSLVDVFIKSTTEADFHGDGMVGQHKVYTPRADRNLRFVIESKLGKQVAEQLFALVANARSLTSSGLFHKLVNGFNFIDMAAKTGAVSVNDRIEAGFTDASLQDNLTGLYPGFKHLNNFGFVGAKPCLTTLKSWHDSRTLQDSGYCGSGDAILNPDTGGRLAVSVSPDDVVSVKREFFAGHVFNLSTDTELYIANGFIVHNCRIRDGKLYTPETHKPIGHSIPWLAGPGRAHWQCRSHQTTVLKSYKELGIDIPEVVIEGKARASIDGQVPSETTYGQWLEKQSAARQDEVLGKTRAKLMRDGKLSMADMHNSKGQFLTLSDLKNRDATAFKRAGL